ncbi:phage recombination protein Bet [Weissella muntiaci]|uniref:Phage recombination protein Bet n=1 Tax=Weissella muntiaci TaxID=2508881 RepID=A0A6C2C8M4_9LACO|nr:phage recombination protein Bet [Weissella muntiaci]TYC49936.1 phage recombination protein Bet [Weissella muntiaci]
MTELDIYNPKNLTAETIKALLPGGTNASNEEIASLLAIVRNQNMNPFTREVYFVKYGSAPAQIVVSRDFYRKRAFKNSSFNGIQVGVIVQSEDGEIEELEGGFYPKEKTLVGAWSKVSLKEIDVPVYVSVRYDEYVQMKGDKPNSMWSKKPATMLTKVAESQALRMAFPDEFSGTYGEEEYPANQERRDITPDNKPTSEEIANFNKDEYIAQRTAALEEKQSTVHQSSDNVEPPADKDEPLNAPSAERLDMGAF